MDVSKIENIFAENFARRGELGATVSVWRDGREIVTLADGWRDRERTKPWARETPVLVYSVTKAFAAASVLHCLETRKLSLHTRVVEIWPEFGAAGKEQITIGEVLSHRAGMPALAEMVSVFDHASVIAAIEKQPPIWPPGTGHGYHPRTFGFLLDEIVRRIAGQTLNEYWSQTFAGPLALDAWIGLPEEKTGAVATIYAPRSAPPDDAFLRAFSDPASLTNRAFGSPRGLHSPSSMNAPDAQRASFPAFGGIATGPALGKFFAMLANGGEMEGTRYFSEESIAWMSTTLSTEFDKVLQITTAFSAGLMKDPITAVGRKVRELFGPSKFAFGQPGAGGSVAFADPENKIAFAYVMNQMEPGVLPNPKALRMIEAAYA
ncbi:MAG: hypothetical protein QOD99_335 [Chthoniobacter sp.]|jgi:CubicO group peptidase (beta-lactamase class C family)|nr:hypothetical protein [Chthoniobacter sp.]